ncbi:hypothetical protein PINS_up015992 [Pythium insidiosum]|nr:hypothetical protein PINS_up015992 [Pythium insidiosum]
MKSSPTPKHATEAREQQLARVQRRLPVSEKRKDKTKAKRSASGTKRKAVKLELHALHDTVDDIQRQVDAASRGIQELRALIDAHLAQTQQQSPPLPAPPQLAVMLPVAPVPHLEPVREHWEDLVACIPDDPLLVEALAPSPEELRFAC